MRLCAAPAAAQLFTPSNSTNSTSNSTTHEGSSLGPCEPVLGQQGSTYNVTITLNQADFSVVSAAASSTSRAQVCSGGSGWI